MRTDAFGCFNVGLVVRMCSSFYLWVKKFWDVLLLIWFKMESEIKVAGQSQTIKRIHLDWRWSSLGRSVPQEKVLVSAEILYFMWNVFLFISGVDNDITSRHRLHALGCQCSIGAGSLRFVREYSEGDDSSLLLIHAASFRSCCGPALVALD